MVEILPLIIKDDKDIILVKEISFEPELKDLKKEMKAELHKIS